MLSNERSNFKGDGFSISARDPSAPRDAVLYGWVLGLAGLHLHELLFGSGNGFFDLFDRRPAALRKVRLSAAASA